MVLGKPIICNKVENKRAVIELFYLEESEDWHEKVHKNGGTVQENIDSTLATISEGSEMYGVGYNGELAAFFVRYEDSDKIVLEGFHVGRKYRDKEFLIHFWQVVRQYMGDVFYTGILKKNNDAKEHLEKQGFVVIGELVDNEQEFYVLKSN